MQEEHKKAIQKNFTSLVERTDLDAMVNALFEKGVFSEAMIEPYRNNSKTQREHKRKLYREITHRGPHAFDNLMDVLREMGYWDLVRDLDPNSPLQLRPYRSTTTNPSPSPKEDDENFVSISTEKKKSKINLEKQKSSLAAPSPPSHLEENDNSSDLNTDIPRFQVKKSIKFMEDDDSKDIKLYRTRGRQRGVLLVFSYTEFKLNIDSFREGVDVDCKNLKYLFSEFGFKMISYNNLELEETRNTLQTMENVLAGSECVFIVFSSHGYEKWGSQDTDIRCSDGNLISFTDILEYFNNRNLPDLAEIPKVFIFQVCRGSTSDYVYSNADELRMPHDVSWDITPTNSRYDALERRAPPPDMLLIEKPMYTNILIAHSTVPGYVSHRDNKKGSWYIQTICEVFAAHAHECHVDRLFTLVDQRMRLKYHIQTSSVDRWGFNRKLYLHPGLFE